eukprot:g2216.t1
MKEFREREALRLQSSEKKDAKNLAQVEAEATEDGDENEEVFTSDEESVITVVTTETVEMETLALESRFVLALDREAAEAESGAILEQRGIAEKQAADENGNALPVIVRRSSMSGSGRESLHLEVDILGIPHKIAVTHSEFDITFVCVNNLGLEKSLTVDASDCAALLRPNEVADLIRYVKARHPELNTDGPAAMVRAWTCELALRRYVTFLTLELPTSAQSFSEENEATTEEDSEDEDSSPMIQLGHEEMVLVLRRAPPRKVVENFNNAETKDDENGLSQDPATSLIHAEAEHAEAEADALVSEQVARSAVVVAVHAAQAASEGFNFKSAVSTNGSHSSSFERDKSGTANEGVTDQRRRVKRKVLRKKKKPMNDPLAAGKSDLIGHNHAETMLKTSASISKSGMRLHSGISADGLLDVEVVHFSLHESRGLASEDLETGSLHLCQWIVHASLGGKAQYTIELSNSDAQENLSMIASSREPSTFKDFISDNDKDPSKFAFEIGSRVWLCDLHRCRPWISRILLAPLLKLEKDRSDDGSGNSNTTTNGDNQDRLQHANLQAENEAQMSAYTKTGVVLMKKSVSLLTDKD